MSRLVARRGRLLRVRHVQHVQAVGVAMEARDQAAEIENNARRIARVREELFSLPGQMLGQSLASHRELAERLEKAGYHLDGQLSNAQRRITETEAQRMHADREREIAERLKDKARREAEDRAEARLAALPRYRRMQMKDDAQMKKERLP
jgi:hypothetical protein